MSDELTVPQQLAIQMIALGNEKNMVAQTCGISRRQLHNWEQSPAFKQALGEIIKDAEDATGGKLRVLADKALSTLEEVMTSPQSPANVRLTAAVKVIDLVLDRPSPLPAEYVEKPVPSHDELVVAVRRAAHEVYFGVREEA
jgi:flagellar hook-basal body complex protein FliE